MLALARASGGGDALDGGWRLGTRPAADSPTDADAMQLKAALAEARAQVAAFEEEVLALEFAAIAPVGVAELPVTFQSTALQVRVGRGLVADALWVAVHAVDFVLFKPCACYCVFRHPQSQRVHATVMDLRRAAEALAMQDSEQPPTIGQPITARLLEGTTAGGSIPVTPGSVGPEARAPLFGAGPSAQPRPAPPEADAADAAALETSSAAYDARRLRNRR